MSGASPVWVLRHLWCRDDPDVLTKILHRLFSIKTNISCIAHQLFENCQDIAL